MRIILDTTVQLVDESYSDRTYGCREDKIEGYIDGLGALKTAIYKIVGTEQYEYPIYSFNYGMRLKDLIGKDMVYVKSELRRRLEECLLADDRIDSVENFKFSFIGDNCECEFDVISKFGTISARMEAVV